jgi:hypothetical protein
MNQRQIDEQWFVAGRAPKARNRTAARMRASGDFLFGV